MICMTLREIGHMGRSVKTPNKHRDTASCFLRAICMEASATLNIVTIVDRKPCFWQHNNVICTIQLGSKGDEFVIVFSKGTYIFIHDKKKSNLRSYNIIESWSGEVVWVTNSITVEFYCYLWRLCRFATFDQSRQLINWPLLYYFCY